MNSLTNKYDPIESLILEHGLKIKGVHFYQEMNLMLIVLSNKRVLRYPLSESDRLKKASREQLENYEFVGKGFGIHWPELDEDLSLKGFLKKELVGQAVAV